MPPFMGMPPQWLSIILSMWPVTPVDKLYNSAANLIAAAIAARLPKVKAVTCYLVRQIGRPTDRRDRSRVARTAGVTWRETYYRRDHAGSPGKDPKPAHEILTERLALEHWPLRL